MSDFQHDQDVVLDTALTLLRGGYVPLRIEHGQKMPRSSNWQIDTPDEDKVRRDFSRTCNIGIRCGDVHGDGTVLVGLDADLEEAELLRCIERAIGEPVPTKRGRKGATYMVRIDRKVKTHKIYWVRDGKKSVAIDVLATGAQTVIPPSIHPDTKEPYRWIAGKPIHEVDYRSLPVFSDALLDEIRGFCKNPDDAIYALNDMEWLGVGGGGNTHDICLAAVSSMVARKWTDNDIMERVVRAKREACETAGVAYDWPQAEKVIGEWIASARDKKFDVTAKQRKGDVPLEFLNRYVYVIELDRMLDREKGQLLGFQTFNNVHARDMAKPWAEMITAADMVLVDKLTYSPGQPSICKEKSFGSEAQLSCFNMYYGPNLEPHDGDVEPFVQLVKDVCDHDEEAFTHVFSFLAHLVQFPGERINHALVIQGQQGIGKDSIYLAMEKVLGAQNCGIVTLQQVESQFNTWAFGKQLIVFSEMLASGRRSVYNKCKNYVTDPILEVNTKHLAVQKIPNRANYIFFTNYKHALSIDPSDRRMWVWYSKMEPKTPEYYTRFYNWLNNKMSANALLQWLLNYDTSKFNPTAAPPMTDAKRSLIKSSSSEVEQMLREAAESHTWPMQCDLVSVTHLLAALRPIMRVSSSMISEALDNIAGEDNELPQRPEFPGGKRPRLRVIRNVKQWQKANSVDIVAAYRLPTPPGAGESEGGYMAWSDSPSSGGPDF